MLPPAAIGASAGIGKGITTVLLERGAHVLGSGRRPELLNSLTEEFSSLDGSFTPVIGDVGSREDCARMVKTANGIYGRVHDQ